jgi:hypothetical protein
LNEWLKQENLIGRALGEGRFNASTEKPLKLIFMVAHDEKNCKLNLEQITGLDYTREDKQNPGLKVAQGNAKRDTENALLLQFKSALMHSGNYSAAHARVHGEPLPKEQAGTEALSKMKGVRRFSCSPLLYVSLIQSAKVTKFEVGLSQKESVSFVDIHAFVHT